jgi:hypothetical protein
MGVKMIVRLSKVEKEKFKFLKKLGVSDIDLRKNLSHQKRTALNKKYGELENLHSSYKKEKLHFHYIKNKKSLRLLKKTGDYFTNKKGAWISSPKGQNVKL